MAEFVLKSNFFEFNRNTKQQISRAAIGTKCAPTYACIFMDELERDPLETTDHQPFLWLRYIDRCITFLITTHGEKRLQTFLERISKLHHNIKGRKETFPFQESSIGNISFSALKFQKDSLK